MSEDAEPSILAHNDSILEMAERQLERNKRKRPLNKTSAKISKKKNMNILNKSVSSEDEVEQLRVQVQDD